MKAALDYVRLQWSVVPLAKGGGTPLIGSSDFAYRIPTTGEIGHWFERWPDANLGIVTGGVSGLLVLQVRPDSGGEQTLAQLQQLHGQLADTVLAVNEVGGRYLYFMHAGDAIADAGAVAKGVELHADGGYVLAPPSSCFEDGQLRWERSPHVYPLAHFPERWQAFARTARLADGEHHRHSGEPLLDAELVADKRQQVLLGLAEHLHSRDVDAGLVLELLQSLNMTRCRPPLEPGQVAGIVGRALAGKS